MSNNLAINTYIEELRLAMYEAYSKDPGGAEVLMISWKLDEALNTEMNNHMNKGVCPIKNKKRIKQDIMKY